MLVDVLSTAVCCVPGLPPTEILDGVVTTVKTLAVGSTKGLDGLMAMKEGSDFLKALNAGPRTASPDTRYFAVDSAFTPDKGVLLSLIAEKSLNSIFGEANDLLVPAAGTAGSNGSAMFPVTDTLRLEGTGGVPHLEYLSVPATHVQLVQWLTA